MNELDRKLIALVTTDKREMDKLRDILARLRAGENMESIAASYGVSLEGIEY